MNPLESGTIISKLKEHFPLYPVPQNVGMSALSVKINNFFNNRTWDAVTADTLLKDSGLGADHSLTWMNDEGYCYYLPAYIRMALGDDADELTWLLEPFLTGMCAYEIFSTFTVGTTPQIDSAKINRFEKFSPDQKRTIARYLEYQAHAPEEDHIVPPTSLTYLARLTLESYWVRYNG